MANEKCMSALLLVVPPYHVFLNVMSHMKTGLTWMTQTKRDLVDLDDLTQFQH